MELDIKRRLLLMKMYEGQEGCLRYIEDILDDHDGCNTVKSLKELIDEARSIAIQGIIKKENYGKQ